MTQEEIKAAIRSLLAGHFYAEDLTEAAMDMVDQQIARSEYNDYIIPTTVEQIVGLIADEADLQYENWVDCSLWGDRTDPEEAEYHLNSAVIHSRVLAALLLAGAVPDTVNIGVGKQVINCNKENDNG